MRGNRVQRLALDISSLSDAEGAALAALLCKRSHKAWKGAGNTYWFFACCATDFLVDEGIKFGLSEIDKWAALCKTAAADTVSAPRLEA